MRRLVAVLVLALTALAARAGDLPAAGAEALAEGDAAFARRAGDFALSGKPDASAVAVAVAAYERAHAAAPSDLTARFRLMEALYFQGHFVTTDERARKEAFTRMADLAEDTCDLVATSAPAGTRLDKLPPDEQARRLAGVPGAAEAHFWAAIAHGLWGMSHSKAAAGFRGTAGRIRDHATILAHLDERFADAAGFRLLGRLHAATPRVPMFTGWIDRAEGVRWLEKALSISDADPRNPLFLAEALLENVPSRRDEALALLRGVAARTPDPSHVVEQTEILDEARHTLASAESAAPSPTQEPAP